MRILMKSRRQDEDGAILVVVALLAVILLVISGFTIDFGQAWMAKRNLQKAADAGALAAAQVLSKTPGTCAVVSANTVAVTAAHVAAKLYSNKNRESYLPASTETEWSVACNAANTAVVVNYGLKGTTNSSFGPLTGSGSTLTSTRRAQAVLEVGQTSSTQVRPLAMCSTQLTAGPFVRLDYPKDAPTACGNASGAWWTVDCPGNASNSTSVMVQQVRNGCPNGVSAVDVNTSPNDPPPPSDLTSTLKAACLGGTTASGSCLESNPGNLDSGQVATSWKYLVDNSITGVFPVFCAPPQCASTTVAGSGNNATFPVYKLLAAVICGYHFSSKENYVKTTGECAGIPTTMSANIAVGGNTVNYLLIKYTTINSSGSNQNANCALGDIKCDGLVRRTRLAN